MRPLLLAALLLAASPALAQDADHGRAVFARACASCHVVTSPRNLMGPHLLGVVGRKIASVDGFNYSTAMKATEGAWTPERLDPYLANPAQVIPGTKMINRLPSDTDRADVIAWLATAKAP